MALTKTINYRGVTIQDAYIRVGYINILENKSSISFRATISAAADQPLIDVQAHTAPYDLDGDNPFAQAYEYLKTLDDYKDATDA